MIRIVTGGIHTECSTGNPLIQQAEDFTVLEGEALLGWADLRPEEGVDVVPIIHMRSVPGGAVSARTYNAFKEEFLKRLIAAMPCDGVLLLMHGAMHVEGMEDAEGDWIAAVRDAVGPDCPIAVSYDLHGNVTQKIVDAIDIFAAYRTAPHEDVVETRNRAFAMLVGHLKGGPRPMVGWLPVPALLPGERSSTRVEPAAGIYATLAGEDTQEGILDANMMVGYVWADTSRATASAVITGTDPRAMEVVAMRIGKAWWDARENFGFDVTTLPLEECLDLALAASGGPVILADSGDNPTGGGVGDRADVLSALLKRDMAAVLAGIADAPATVAAARAGEGALLALQIGNAFGSDGPVLDVHGEVLKSIGCESERTLEVLVSVGRCRIILTQRRRPFHDLADFRRFGIEPAEEDLLVVKSGYLSPELSPLACPALMALTDGAVNQDIEALPNTKRPSGTWPFQRDAGWCPEFHLSLRCVSK